MRLFVDVDDTLVLYEDTTKVAHPYGYDRGEPYSFNWPLVEGIRQFRQDNPDGLIIVWSGGGAAYACVISVMIGIHGIVDRFLAKDATMLRPIDEDIIVVDDMDVPWRTHGPFDWPEKESFTCPKCGPYAKADEDGCCATCGVDCV